MIGYGKMKRKDFSSQYLLTNIYMLFTVSSLIFLYFNNLGMSLLCFVCGPTSIYIAISFCGFAANEFLIKCSALWLLSFTPVLIIAYITTLITKRFFVFWGVTTADTIVVFMFYVLASVINEVGSDLIFLLSGSVGIIFSGVLLFVILKKRKNAYEIP